MRLNDYFQCLYYLENKVGYHLTKVYQSLSGVNNLIDLLDYWNFITPLSLQSNILS